MTRITIYTLFILLMNSCEKKASLWPYGVNYEVNVRSFADSNGDGIGDLPGMTSKLDYLSELGIGVIWLSPVMPAKSFHKYNVEDYKGIDSEYGSIEDFKELTRQAHQKDIRIIIDLVLSFSSANHTWFKEASKGPDNVYRNYYVWAKKDSVEKLEDKKHWFQADGDPSGDFYYSRINKNLPNLNFDNPKVKQEFVDIGKFWLTEMGADGFRLGAAEHIFPANRMQDNIAFWEWYRKQITQFRPDAYLLGEVWSTAQVVAPFQKGLPSLFDFDLYHAIVDVVKAGTDTANLVKKQVETAHLYKTVTEDFIDETFINNHDFNRICSELGNDDAKARLAASILFTLPGTPFLYYGEEIGMKGMQPGEYLREPFIWDDGKNDPMQTSWLEAKYSTDQTVVPLRKQLNDPNSMYSYYKKWITYRNSSEVLTKGSLDLAREKRLAVVSFIRSFGNQKRLVMHNVSDVEVTIPTDSMEGFTAIEFSTYSEATWIDNELRLPALGTVVLKMN
jgi:alpha-amylase